MEFGDYRYSLEENYKNTLRDFSNFEGLTKLMNEIMDLRESEIYEKTLLAFNNPYPYASGVDRRKMVIKFYKEVLIFKLAKDGLKRFPFRIPSLTGLIDLDTFSTIPTLFEFLYYRDSGHLLNTDELEQIDSGILTKKVVFNLDEFDTALSVPEPVPKFFKKLRKMKWQDKNTEKLFKKIRTVNDQVFYEKWENSQLGDSDPVKKVQLAVFEEMVLLTLSGCSAAVECKTKITWKDIKRAYRTYFKLLNTDITKLM